MESRRTFPLPSLLSALTLFLFTSTFTLSASDVARTATGSAKITILYDAFGQRPEMQKDWGYSALIEYDGKPRAGK